jgi:hypothetical protein
MKPTWGSLERNTSKRLIDRFYGVLKGSHDRFPSKGFQTPGNAVYEHVRGFGLVSFGDEGLVSCSLTMRVWSSLFQREGFGLLSLGDEGFVSSSLNTRVSSRLL